MVLWRSGCKVAFWLQKKKQPKRQFAARTPIRCPFAAQTPISRFNAFLQPKRISAAQTHVSQHRLCPCSYSAKHTERNYWGCKAMSAAQSYAPLLTTGSAEFSLNRKERVRSESLSFVGFIAEKDFRLGENCLYAYVAWSTAKCLTKRRELQMST